jgi:thymidine kinase
MFSGKTEELIRRLKRAQFAKSRNQTIITPYDDEMVVSHDAMKFVLPVPAAANIFLFGTRL